MPIERRNGRVASATVIALYLTMSVVACRRSGRAAPFTPDVVPESPAAVLPTSGKKCVVHLHGKGGAGAKLYCRGEAFGDTVVGYVIDDPVPDHGVEPCRPRAGTKLALYSTGALANATDGWDCTSADWTCEGDSTIGITRYAGALRTPVVPSPNHAHEANAAPPEETSWW